MSNYGFRVIKDFERPDPALVEAFRGIPTANIADKMNRMSCIEGDLKPANDIPLLGVALTIRAPGGDNLMFHKAVDLAKPGDVLVFSSISPSNRSILGELMVGLAKSRGIAGFVVDGYIRDIDGIRSSGFPCYYRGINSNGPFKNGPGEINVPIAVGGQVIFPGDIIVGDGDAVCVIRPEDAADICRQAKELHEQEIIKERGIREGKGLKRDWLDAALAAKNCVFIDK